MDQTPSAQPMPAPAQAPTPTPAASSVSYTSNPFSLLIKSFGSLLMLNGAQGLLLAVRIVVVTIIIGLIAGLLVILNVPIVAFIAIFLVYVYMIFAFTTAFAVIGGDSANNQASTSKEMFSQVNRTILPMAGLLILSGLAITVGLILLVIPGLIIGAWFSLAPYVMVSEKLGIIDSMKRSKQLVSGHIFEMWGMILAATVLSGSGLLSFLVVPSAMMGRYTELKALKASNAPKPEVHWSNYVLPVAGFILIGGYILLVVLLAAHGVQNSATQTNNLYYTTPSQ